MIKSTLEFLPTATQKEVEELAEELGLKDPRVFVRKAVEDKLRDLKRAAFFGISDRVAAGLRRKGIRPVDLLRQFKS